MYFHFFHLLAVFLLYHFLFFYLLKFYLILPPGFFMMSPYYYLVMICRGTNKRKDQKGKCYTTHKLASHFRVTFSVASHF